MTGLTGMTRALACLALEHGDDEGCPSSDEELAQALIHEVRRLRQLVGEEPPVRSELAETLDQALRSAAALGGRPALATPGLLAVDTIRELETRGWTLARTPE